MAGESVREMSSKFAKLEKFEGQDFRRWKKKMHFLLTNLKVVYVLSTPMPEEVENETIDQQRRRLKWENDDYICRGHILNGMSDALFDVYQNAESAKELWDSLESKYMADDATSKKFLVSNFNNYKMIDSRPVMEQYNELLHILGQYTQHDLKMDESIAVSSIIDKLPPLWKDYKRTLKHQKEDLTLVQLGSHIRIEESLRAQEDDKTKGKNIASSSVNVVEHDGKPKKFNKFKGNKRKFSNDANKSKKKTKFTCWRCGMSGHLKKDCRVKLSGNNKGSGGAGPSGSKDPPTQTGRAKSLQHNVIEHELHSVCDNKRFVVDTMQLPLYKNLKQCKSSICKTKLQHKNFESKVIRSTDKEIGFGPNEFRPYALKFNSNETCSYPTWPLNLENKVEQAIDPTHSKHTSRINDSSFNFNSVLNYVSFISESFLIQDDEFAWWVDSGATIHVCKDLRWFEEFKPSDDGSILRMGNVATEPIKGAGKVRLIFTSGKQLLLEYVLYVPGIRKNLLSGIVLNNLGFKQVIESDKFILSRHGTFVGFGYLSNGMFKLNVNVPFANESVCVASSSNNKVDQVSNLWHARLGHVNYFRMRDMSKMSLIPPFDMHRNKCHTCKLTKITRKPFKDVNRDSKVLDLIHSDLCDFHSTPSLGNKKYVITFIDDASRFCYVYLLHSKDEALDKFKIYKQEVELHQNGLIKNLRTDRGGEYCDPVYFQSTGIIHQTTAPYTPQQNGVAERKNRTLKEMVNSMLSYSGLSEGFWGEAMLTACHLLNRIPNKRTKVTSYELWCKKAPNLSYLRVWGCRAVVRLTEPKIRTLGERGIDCIFIGYAEHSPVYRFYVIEPNDFVAVHTVIESKDADFGNEDRFSSIPRLKDMPQSLKTSTAASTSANTRDVPSSSTKPRKSTRARKAKSFGDDFQLYLVEGSRDGIKSQYQYCYNIEEDPKTFSEAMASRDASFWKEAVQDEMDSIIQSKTWKLTNLPPGCKALGCKWIFKRKKKVDGSIDKFKARLVIQGFRQKEGIDFFDTYAPVARISTIRLLLALASIHNLVIHQMDVNTAFLNGELDEEIYMKQPEGFVVPGNEHKVCKLVKSLYGLKQAPKQWHQKFDDVVLSDGFVINQADKCVYSKFDSTGKGVIICLYVDDMLIFGTDQGQVDKTKEFLSSKFAMKDMGEAEVILGIRITRGNNSISISQSHYIEKMLKKFNFQDCSPVGTPIDPNIRLMPNQGDPISQLEYSKAIGCLMYAMISTRPDIAYAVGKLSRYTSNPSTHHWQAINRLFKYLKGTMNYSLCYSGFPSVLEGYSDASWITNMEDYSSTSGWVFLLGGGAISWASKKQTCITSSTMESEFVALAAAGKEAEWLRNLIFEIPLWSKPISPISIRCDSAATLAKAYSQVNNDKSRHLGVRHGMIRELIMNGVISIEFVRSEYNMADHLTKGLGRDLVNKSAKGMGLKSIL
ncbi:hypothetical protein QVD17_39315 [Tagetes erecta]|uniref:Zinc finger, CCHC-type n=1 Tax=Tagetes erecta TaxID=13708 RepID=A0AAD8JPU2_TARER|nr:hypothetical protein QVD17_39315 [Tagetes erecta]